MAIPPCAGFNEEVSGSCTTENHSPMVAPLVIPREHVAHALRVEVVRSVGLLQLHLPPAIRWNDIDQER